MARLQFAVACAGLATASALSGVTTATAAQAAVQTYQFNIPAGDLDTALRGFARTTRQQILFRGRDVRGKRSSGLTGLYSASEALTRLLDGTGLSFSRNDKGVFLVQASLSGMEARSDQQQTARTDGFGEAGAGAGADIVVTGSHIRGAPPTAPVTVVTSEAMKQAGQNNLGEVMRSLPQNFSGGQNPGVQTGGEGFGDQNVNSASQANIRGLGVDATLTLLNGRRLPYDLGGQGVDISAIPTVAVERIEVLADGASALYGSDAVGGVVNVILKKKYEGLQTSARIAGATDGGDFQQQYSAVAGHTWASGNILLAGDYSHSSQVTAGQRDLTSALWPDGSLYPRLKSYGGVVTANQHITSNVTFSLDAAYNRRTSFLNAPLSTTGNYLSYGALDRGGSKTFFVSPSLNIGPQGPWNIEIYSTYGSDVSYRDAKEYLNNSLLGAVLAKYKNQDYSAEVNAEGPLISLSAGDVRLALGAGYRGNKFAFLGSPKYSASNNIAFGYAELFVPIFSPAQGKSWAHQLSLTLATRDEDYDRGVGNVVTPKIGLIYAPTADLDVKASWGRSFKAPTLSLQYNPVYANARTASSMGGVGYPPTASIVYLTGGNRDLRPERATTTSVTLSLHPRAWSPFKLELSYYRTNFKNRIQAVIPTQLAYLGDPAYDFVRIYYPTIDQINAAAAQSTSGTIRNYLSVPFDPANVVAIVDNRVRNVASQYVRGVDATASYKVDLPNGSVTTTASASYLNIKQRLYEGAAPSLFSGTIFRAPAWRARAGATWEYGKLVTSAFVNFTDGVDDTRYMPATRVSGMTTFDLTFGYTFGGPGLLNKLRLQASAINLFNAMPDNINTVACPSCTPWDSANYSILGRLIGLSVSKDW